MSWLGGILSFLLGVLFGIVFSGILTASSRESDKEFFYNLGRDQAIEEMENGDKNGKC